MLLYAFFPYRHKTYNILTWLVRMAFFRPPIMIYLKMIQKAPIHELVIFVQGNDETKEIFPQIKVNKGSLLSSCTYLDDAGKNLENKRVANHLLIWHRKSIKRQNGSAGILTSKNKAIINEYNRFG